MTRQNVSSGGPWEDVVGYSDAVGRAHAEFFRTIKPAATMVVIKELIDPLMLVEIEADAWVGE